MIDESEYKDRFKFLGWVETKNIPYIYKRANIGINVDKKCTETYKKATEANKTVIETYKTRTGILFGTALPAFSFFRA